MGIFRIALVLNLTQHLHVAYGLGKKGMTFKSFSIEILSAKRRRKRKARFYNNVALFSKKLHHCRASKCHLDEIPYTVVCIILTTSFSLLPKLSDF
jgi:hypothetical protein